MLSSPDFCVETARTAQKTRVESNKALTIRTAKWDGSPGSCGLRCNQHAGLFGLPVLYPVALRGI